MCVVRLLVVFFFLEINSFVWVANGAFLKVSFFVYLHFGTTPKIIERSVIVDSTKNQLDWSIAKKVNKQSIQMDLLASLHVFLEVCIRLYLHFGTTHIANNNRKIVAMLSGVNGNHPRFL